MSRNKITYLMEFFVTQMNHWALFPVFALVLCLAQTFCPCDEPSVLLWMAMGLLPLLFYCFRVRFRHFSLLLAAHAAVCLLLAIGLPCETNIANILYTLVGIGYTVYSLSVRLHQRNFQSTEIMMPVAVGFSAVSLFLLHARSRSDWDFTFLMALIAVFGLYFCASYLKNFLHFLTVNENSTGHIPEREIFWSGSVLVLIFAGFSMLLLFLLSGVEWLKTILSVVKSVVAAILRFLLSLMPESPDVTVTPDTYSGAGNDWQMPVEEESSLFWIILQYTITALVVIALAVMAVKALLQLIAFIRSRMRQQLEKVPAGASPVVDVREKCAIEKKDGRKGRIPLFHNFSPREQIRRLYKKKLLSEKNLSERTPGTHDTPELQLLTAREWEERLSRPDMERRPVMARPMAVIYEKARYSEEECDRKDVEQMRQACRR